MYLLKFYFFSALISLNLTLNSQNNIKVAILDFENTSNVSKYDGFGKALSNMLITDLKNFIHPRKATFMERSQLNKILKEQELQSTSNFDKSTTVDIGKLAGVDFVILGSVYVLEENCNISARLVNVETSEIEYSKDSNGNITGWLQLKSKLAEEISSAINNPIIIEDEYKEAKVSEGVITQYASLIEKVDKGDFDSAEETAEVLSDVMPDFKYFDELKYDIEELKKQVEENTKDINTLKKSGGLVLNLSTIDEYVNNIQSSLLSSDEKDELLKQVFLKFDFSEIIKNSYRLLYANYPFGKVVKPEDIDLTKIISLINETKSQDKKQFLTFNLLNRVVAYFMTQDNFEYDIFSKPSLINFINENLYSTINKSLVSKSEFTMMTSMEIMLFIGGYERSHSENFRKLYVNHVIELVELNKEIYNESSIENLDEILIQLKNDGDFYNEFMYRVLGEIRRDLVVRIKTKNKMAQENDIDENDDFIQNLFGMDKSLMKYMNSYTNMMNVMSDKDGFFRGQINEAFLKSKL